MEPVKTHGTALPQQALTRPAEGCPSGPRPEDLMLGGHEGANPHAGQRVATTDDQSTNMDQTKSLTKLEIYRILVDKAHTHGIKMRPLNLDSDDRCLTVLKALYPNGIPSIIDTENKEFKNKITKFIDKCETLYKNSKRNFNRFCNKNKTWLSTIFDIEVPKLNIRDSSLSQPNVIELEPTHLVTNIPSKSIDTETCSFALQNTLKPHEHELSIDPKPGTSFDVPSCSTRSFEDLSDRQKRRACRTLEESLEDEPDLKIIKVMSHIVKDETGKKLSRSSVRELEYVVNECLKSPTRPKKIASTIKSKSAPKPYTPDEALSFIIDRKLTVYDYTTQQKDLKERGFPAYPPYYKVQMAKKKCYPEEDITFIEREANVSLQSVLLHTFRRIVEFCDEQISDYYRQKQKRDLYCTLEGSWGFDGSTGQSFCKQKFIDAEDGDNKNCLFATTYIPLQLKTQDGFALWTNPCPQSFRFCRPLKIQYRKETKELIMSEKMRVENEIKTLNPLYAETVSSHTLIANPLLHLTIIDGKVYDIITGTTSQLRCACCGATAVEFNNLKIVSEKNINPEALRHGLSPLHAWIRIFEFLLHLGYKNNPAVMKWRVNKNTPEAKIVEERKKTIQAEIRAKMSLLVDVVLPNAGTTNDGNTARTALSDEHRKTFAEILGLEMWLVEDLHTILVALSSGLHIDVENFDGFCRSLAKKYVQTYEWFYMSVYLHRILIHGRGIIEASTLPIGMLSEQDGETRNKYWRYDREHNTRKLNRETTILDLFNRALESSDPYLSSISLRNNKQQKRLPIPNKVLRLLKVTSENVHYIALNSETDDITLTRTDEIII